MRVLLADDQPEIRSAMRLLLEQEVGINVVGEASEAQGLLCQASAIAPDVVLLDWELPGDGYTEAKWGAGTRLVRQLHADYPNVRVVALSGRPEARQFAMEAGADAFVSKGDPPEHLLAVLQCVGSPASTATT
jgi:DNA-binding NarL/FixJ family response regulator